VTVADAACSMWTNSPSLAGADDRHLLPANLLAHITGVRIPGARSVKESVMHRDAVYFRYPKGCRFEQPRCERWRQKRCLVMAIS